MQEAKLIDPSLIMLNVEATEKEEVITLMAKKLISEGYVKGSYLNAILEREKEYPTGLPTNEVGVAIPHTDIEHVIKPGIAVATLKNPVKFNAMGNPDEEVDVKLIFMLAVTEPKGQINLLKKLVSIFQNQQLLMELCDIKSKKECAKILNTVIDMA
ncbi:MAG TPA: PTS sugar transporter subunit IIA [Tepidanaerobacter syntrophicus]|uniref:PTS sugar transporter subunit IIA n=1 Tax=Tepidanaerobacter syntrophicus TaxID=224999 RepID=UPI00176E04F5|nr:PTS sugar transporter subunit IIA [Tepidanaerobacter syntrophicus]HHV82871.1 PTS sugar transporter subunit IIA [Tepidanaerobacter syntrophicus]